MDKKKARNGVALLTALSMAAGGAALMNNNDNVVEADYKAGEFIVELEEGKTLADVEALDDYMVTTKKLFTDKAGHEDFGNVYVFDPVNDSKLDKILKDVKSDSDVENVSFNYNFQIKGFKSSAPDDPMWNKLWGMDKIDAEGAHKYLKENGITAKKNAVVSIVDTGTDDKHEDLEAVVKLAEPAKDGHGHGSHCAGSAAAVTNNGIGVGSLSYDNSFITITPFKVLDDNGGGTLQGVAEGIIKAADAGADVISMSLGASIREPPKLLVDACQYAMDKGTIIVAAAGNEDSDALNSTPANIEGVIAIGASTEKDGRAYFSNYGEIVKVSAPGTNILSTVPGGYDTYSGTSMATPHTAGLVGMLKAVNPSLDSKQVLDIMVSTGDEIKQDANKPIGKRINAYKAIQKAYEMGQ